LNQSLLGYNIPGATGGSALTNNLFTGTPGTPGAFSFGTPSSWNGLIPTGGIPAQSPTTQRTTILEPGGKEKTFNITDLFANSQLQPFTPGYHPGAFALGSLANQASIAANPQLAGLLGQLQATQAPSPLLGALNQRAL